MFRSVKRLFNRDWFLDSKGDPDWAIRRRIIIYTLLWGVSLVTYIAIWGKPDSLREAIVTNVILLMGGVIGSYVFGVAWDNKNKASAEATKTAIEQSDTTTTEVRAEVP